MKSKRFSDEQIIRILHEAEAGLSVADICRKHNCSEQSSYRWKAKTVGRDEQVIREYIRHQEAEDRRIDQLQLM